MAVGIEEIYDKYFSSHYSRFNKCTEEEYNAAAEGYALNYKSLLPESKNANILDIGCGTGHFLYYLKMECYNNHYGIDISKQQVDICKEFVTQRVEAVSASEFLSNKKEIYDLIVMNDCLEHIPKIELIALLELLYTALKHEGTVIVKVPNMANPFGLRARYIDITHEIGFTEESLQQILGVVGFDEIYTYGHKEVVTSIKNHFKRILRAVFFKYIRLLYSVAAYGKPTILTANIIAVGKKIKDE